MWHVLFALSMSMGFATDKFTYPAQKISLQGIKNIKIVGVKGSVKLRGRAGGHTLSLRVRHSAGRRFDDWHMSVERERHTLVIEVFNVSYGKEWKNQVRRDTWPDFDIELDGPARPTIIGWRDGLLETANWNAEIEASILSGRAKIRGGAGRLTLRPVEAVIDIRDHSGEVSIEGQAGRVYLARLNGDTRLNWLRGEVSLLKCVGHLQIEGDTAQVRVAGGSGDLKIRLENGLVRLSGFHGPVDGESRKAQWDLAASAPADVNVRSASGAVGVRWKGGAKVFLTSTRGTIQFPNTAFLHNADREGRRIVEGTKADKPVGQVFVRTESGPITWSTEMSSAQ